MVVMPPSKVYMCDWLCKYSAQLNEGQYADVVGSNPG